MSEFVKLGSLVDITKEQTNPNLYKDKQFKHYSLPNFDNGKFALVEVGDEIKSNKFLLNSNHVLISKLNPRTPRVWAVKDVESDPVPSIASTEFVCLKPLNNSDLEFISYSISSDQVFRVLDSIAIGTTNSHTRFRPEELLNLEIFFPSSHLVREKITRILSSIDKKIELTERLIEKKGLAKQGLLVNLFSAQPEDSLRNIANVIMGQSPPSITVSDNLDDGLPFLQGCAEFSRRYPIPFKSCFGECKKAPPKSVLISVRAPVGDTNIADREYAIGRGLAAIFPKGKIEPDYLAFAIEFSKPKLRKVAQGSTFEAVGSQDILNLKVNFHSKPGDRNKVSEILNAIDSEIEFNIRLLEKLKFQKQGLMQDLLTGQVRVSW